MIRAFQKLLVLVTLTLFTALIAPSARANPTAFDSANQAYDAGDFKAARDGYESLVAEGNYSANLFYNLGNAWYRLHEPGRAMLNYERALALNPAHPEAASDLAFLREQTRAQVRDQSWTRKFFPDIRLDLFAVVAAVAGWTALFAVAALIFHAGRRKPVLAVLILSLLVVAYAIPAIQLSRSGTRLAVVTAGKTVARFAPVETAPDAATLPAGSHIQLLVSRGDWVYAKLPDSRRLWIPAADVEQVRSPRS